MENNNDNLQFLICSQCNGVGYLVDKKCHVCDGQGVISYLNGNILYWGKKIDAQYLKLYKIEGLIYKLGFIILVMIALLGLASLAYSLYLVDFEGLLDTNFWTDNDNIYHLIFWVSLIFDLFLFYYSSIAKNKKEVVISKKYTSQEETEVLPPPPIDWQQVKTFKSKNRIDISKSFSQESVRVIEKAFELASKYHALEVSPVHFFIASLVESKKVSSILMRLEIDLEDLASKIGRVAAKSPESEGQTVFSSNSAKILIKAYRLAYLNKLDQVEVAEILQEAIKSDEMIQEVLYDMNINLEKINNVIIWARIRRLLQKQWFVYRASSKLKSKTGIDRAMTAVQTAFLNRFSEDLTLLAKMAYLDLCIDRDKEFAEMFRVLEGSTIKSIVLVGDTGVGKTAVIEGLAQKMIADDVPEFLRDKRLVSLSISRLVSGASSSEAQERLLVCLNEIISAGNVVLYIDNIHDLIGISSGGGDSLDLSDVLVEAVSKGALFLITSTDPVNYSSYVEKTSLGNIIKKIDIAEPDLNGAIQILEGKVGVIENKNSIFFSYDALEQAVKLTDRYVPDQFLPYKAITLLEEVAVWARKSKGAGGFISGNDVAALLSEKIKMPVSEITASEKEKLLSMEKLIHERIIGQEEAVKAVSNSLRRARAELRETKRPIANLLFLGPTGVGKTELTKAIAAIYFGSEENMIRLDMSEYQEKASLNRLIGAPPGYGQSQEGGQLTEAVRKKPFSIVLLDELEKAHPDILNVFLQVMEDGRLTDSTGRTVDFTNAIIIATSNAQTSLIQEKVKEGVPLEDIKKLLLESELKEYFRPEFINRFDNVIVFRPLAFDDVLQIAKLLLKGVAKNLEDKGINFQATEEAIKELAEAGFDPQYGARPLRRAIQERVNNALAEYLLTGKIDRRDIAILEKGGGIRIEKAKEL
ncbi:AAA family ATPase [Patescibacteria group bacterium]